MIDLETEVCVCNSVTFKELTKHIRENNTGSLDELLANEVCPVGDKCESCKDAGYNNDGLNLPLALSLAHKQN